eukprot:scaffold103949_cov22-Tisochrysis_lutea.AAC.5
MVALAAGHSAYIKLSLHRIPLLFHPSSAPAWATAGLGAWWPWPQGLPAALAMHPRSGTAQQLRQGILAGE